MATGGAELAEMKKQKAVLAARALLRTIPESDLDTFSYSTAAAGVILDVDAGTLTDARDKRIEALNNKTQIHPLSLESIHFLDTQPKAKYIARELRNFLDRVGHASSLHISSQKLAYKYPAEIAPKVMIGFQIWLSEADPDELWPFCIQNSGRPMDLLAAMQTGQTTETVEWMTIREFGGRSADAASHDFHERQKQAVSDGSSGLTVQFPQTGEDRWQNPGGPI